MLSEHDLFSGSHSIVVRAFFVGERIDLRAFEESRNLAWSPLVTEVGEHGCAVLFRYGAVVFFNVDSINEGRLLQQVKSMVTEGLESPELEEQTIILDDGLSERMRIKSGELRFDRLDILRVQIIADIMSKSVALDWHEKTIARVMHSVEPLAASLREKGRVGSGTKKLMQRIGEILHMQHQMIGRVEVHEKPEFLWEHPELERIYFRLEDEYELIERHTILERKLELIASTTETAIELMRHRSSLRVEWYITILIVVEIVITLVENYLH